MELVTAYMNMYRYVVCSTSYISQTLSIKSKILLNSCAIMCHNQYQTFTVIRLKFKSITISLCWFHPRFSNIFVAAKVENKELNWVAYHEVWPILHTACSSHGGSACYSRLINPYTIYWKNIYVHLFALYPLTMISISRFQNTKNVLYHSSPNQIDDR